MNEKQVIKNAAGSVIEWQGILEGNQAVVLFTTRGHRTGYVGVGPDHPFYGKGYNDTVSQKIFETVKDQPYGKRSLISVLLNEDAEDIRFDILFDVHGSITYANANPTYPVESTNLWWFGFDCAHFRDATDFESLRKYYPDVYEPPNLFVNGGEIRTLEYCKEECLSLSKQLNFFKEFMEDPKNGF